MTPRDKIRKKLETLYHSYNGADGGRLPIEEALDAIVEVVESDVIGEDELMFRKTGPKDNLGRHTFAPGEVPVMITSRNKLRASQRAALRGGK